MPEPLSTQCIIGVVDGAPTLEFVVETTSLPIMELSDDTIDAWMNAYGLKSKLRIAPTEMQLINSTKASECQIKYQGQHS